MTIDLTPQQTAHLTRAIKNGRAFLVLGAGASKTCKNRYNRDVKLGAELAASLAEEAGLTYRDEALPDVLQAVRGEIIAEPRFHEILADEYLQVKPSNELIKLLSYTWVRCYSWNIDDAIQNIKGGAQSKLEFNGLIDSVYTDHAITQIPIIYLHGQAHKPESGFIFSPSEYNEAILAQRHKWYKQIAIDYGTFTPIFIGSRLAEPILSLELDRAKTSTKGGLGQAYLVDPSQFSAIEIASLRSRGIVIINGNLDDFVRFLDSELDGGLTPSDVAGARSEFARHVTSDFRLSPAQIEASQSIVQFSAKVVDDELRTYSPEIRDQAGRMFLEGSIPNWRLARSDAAVELSQVHQLTDFVKEVYQDDQSVMGVVIGQLASGKTTALMQSLMKFSEQSENHYIYQIRQDARSLLDVFDLLGQVRQDNEKMILYFDDITPFGDSFSQDIERLDPRWFKVFTSARTGEWSGRLGRRLKGHANTFKFERFAEEDYGPLIERLIQYVPSPALLRLSGPERTARLANSKSQLLIAMKEATSSRNFNALIADEYNSLEKVDYKLLLLICGLGSLGRTGIAKGMLEEAYSYLKLEAPFDESISRLDGIISNNDSRYLARHELYVRHIFENVAELDDILDSISAVLSTFTQIRHPVIKNVPRLDAVMFKFLLNHQFVKDLSWRHGDREAGLSVYRRFDREFQLDGHFWLQYGQYLTEIRSYEDALDKLTKSIDAYPENQFALHALADLQLRVAQGRPVFDAETRQLIGDAVQTLNTQDASSDLGSDYYPIVTLAYGHIGALIAHKRYNAAKDAANDYLTRIKKYRKLDEGSHLRKAQTKLLTFLSTAEW